MTVTLTYDTTLSRVRVNATGLGSSITATVERSTDQLNWTTVRGAMTAQVVAGALVTVDDYEFSDSVQNFYRVTYADTITFVASGAAAHAANTSVTPTVPTGSTTGDLLLILAATRSSGQGTPTVPSGYFEIVDAANFKLFGKIHDGSEPNPTVTFAGAGDATMSVSAQMATFRNTTSNVTYTDVIGVLNAVAQNIAWPALIISINNALILLMGWKQDDWTSTTPSTGTKIGDPSTTLGDDQGITWARTIQTAKANIGSGTFTVSGGATAVSRALVISIAPHMSSQSSSITPVLDDVWIKSLGRPFLNRPVTCVGNPVITRGSRASIDAVVGQSLPIGTDERRESRAVRTTVTFHRPTERSDFNVIIGTGDPLFFHTPVGHPLPTMYTIIDNTVENRPVVNPRCNDDDWRQFELPLREIATPGASVSGSEGTWQTVIDTYVSWSAVLAAKPTWLALTELVGSVSEVVTQ